MPMLLTDRKIAEQHADFITLDRYAHADRRDAFLMSNYVAVGGAHHVTMATQGMDVYERTEFDRHLPHDETEK